MSKRATVIERAQTIVKFLRESEITPSSTTNHWANHDYTEVVFLVLWPQP